MRPSVDTRSSFPVLAALACFGCGACVDDHVPPAAPAGSGPATVAATVLAASSGPCAPGVVLPAGYAPIVEIPSLGGNQAFVEDINDDGVAVGGEQAADGNYHAFRYTDLGGLADLGTLPGFGSQSYATAIAPDGAIAGHADHSDGTGVLFGLRYTASLGRAEVCATGCSVWDLNGRGQSVGLLLGQRPSSWQAFVHTAGGALQTLGTLGGARSSASGINEAGVIVGNSQLAGSPEGDIGHAFIYDPRAATPRMRDLNDLAKASAKAFAKPFDWVLQSATDVNGGYVVGWGMHDGQKRAFRMDLQTNTVVDLGTLAGAGGSMAWAADEAGDVVGWSENGPHRNSAFVYGTGLGGLRRLGDFVDPALGWDLQSANALNVHGAIVGWGYHQGAARGYKLVLPVCLH